MKKYLVIGNAQSVHLVKWVKELVKYFEVYIISSTSTHDDIKAIIPQENIYNLNLPVREEGGNAGILKKIFIVKNIIKKIDPDFVNPHYITSHGFLAALIKKTSGLKFKLIQSAWGSDILVTPFKSTLYYKITKFCLNAAILATSDSEYMTKVINDISPVKVSTFIFGIDKLPDTDIDEKDENLFYSNRILSGNYNIDKVIRFFKIISDENPGARLIISNDGPLRNELVNLTKELQLENKIRFKGFISLEEQVSFYGKAQFYISVPTSDSTSVSLIEAMAFGCIPIVSDIPANREWIEENKNGLFLSSGTGVNDLKSILKKKEDIFNENRKIIAERALFPKSIKEYVETINTL
jgi:glycosyltransferase involved in cell wall biosynthesis